MNRAIRTAFISLLFLYLFAPSARAGDTYDMLQWSFDLPQVQGNPFDFTANDVQVTISLPDGSRHTLPAFFDGDTPLRVRHTPDAPGVYTVQSITVNGKEVTPQNLDHP